METDRATSADGCSRGGASGRSTRHQWNRACVEKRLPLVRLPARIRSCDHDLQPVCSVGAARHLGKSVPRTCRERTIRRHANDRLYPRESPSLCGRRKRGEKKQAVGRSRGGRNTKIHALADAKGRLIAILLTTGAAHDRPVAERLIRRSEAVETDARRLGLR